MTNKYQNKNQTHVERKNDKVKQQIGSIILIFILRDIFIYIK